MLSVGVEAYQALFTGRNCSTVDVLMNATGAVLGWLCGLVALQVAGRARGTLGG